MSRVLLLDALLNFPLAEAHAMCSVVVAAVFVGSPLSVMYGGEKKDWMDKTFGQDVVSSYARAGGVSGLHYVDAAGHQLILDAPDDVCDMLVDVTRSRPAK